MNRMWTVVLLCAPLALGCGKDSSKASSGGGEKAAAGKSKPAAGGEKSKPASPEAAKPSKPAKPGKYQGGPVEGGGTIKGTVKLEGDRPTVEAFPINKDTEFCDAAKAGKRESVRLVVGEGGGVKNAVVSLTNISSGKAMAGGGPYTLDQKGCTYEPHILVVPKKAKVTLKSSDTILHNIHMFGAANYNLPFPDPMGIDKAMRKAGVVWMQCDAGHGWMSAFVHVVEHPYHAITDANGAFTLSDVPPGKYKIRMWHEHWKVSERIEKDGVVSNYVFEEPIEVVKDVEVAAGGEVTVDFGLQAN